MIVIVDYGMGNLGSISNMLKKIGAKNIVSSKIVDIEGADKLILPGVGAFDNAIKNIKNLGIWEVLNKTAKKGKIPIMGICLGMQLLSKRSEEGVLKGFGWVDAKTIRFRFNGNDLKIPHMGWNTIKMERDDGLLKNLENPRFYFVHSYHLVCNNEKDILAKTSYGYDFTSIVRNENIMGVQFHPEKSHKFGMQILKNFAEEI